MCVLNLIHVARQIAMLNYLVPPVTSCATTGRATRKTGAEKSRDMTIYGEEWGRRTERSVSAPIDTFLSFEAFLFSLSPFSYPFFFHHLHLDSHNSLFMARSQSLLTPEPSHIVRQPVSICHVCVFQPPDRRHHLTVLGCPSLLLLYPAN